MPKDNSIILSIVSPVYLTQQYIDELVVLLKEHLGKLTVSWEIILVDDGSPDDAWATILKNNQKDPRVKGIKFSRNFGQHNAIVAGLGAASGDFIIVMDGDLQDDPKEISRLFAKAKEGYDVVFARRVKRNDFWVTRMGSVIFYKLLSYLTGYKQDHTIANYGIYSKRVIQSILQLKEQARWLPLNVKWAGFKSVQIDVEHQKREKGFSAYSLKKRIQLASQLIVTFSDKPLRLTVKLGMLISTLAFIVGIYFIVKSFFVQIPVVGWLSLMVSIWFLFGILITLVGVIGLYIGRILEEAKARPLFIIEEKTE